MNTEYLATLTLRRFMWVQDFAARLAELGAPASIDALLELGRERFNTGPKRDPVTAAETAWGEWPTEY